MPKKALKSFFKMQLKKENWTPSIREVTYKWADWEEHVWLEFEWYASTKHVDRGHDIVEPTAFKKTMKTFMENPQIFLQHDSNKPIWSITQYNIDDAGLFVKGIVKIDTDNVFQKLRTGVIKTMSIWFRIKKYETKTEDDIRYWIIQEIELFEISLVSVPMNPKAKIKSMEDIPEDASDEEYKEFFQVDKEDDFPLYKSVEITLEKAEEAEEENEESNEEVEVEQKEVQKEVQKDEATEESEDNGDKSIWDEKDGEEVQKSDWEGEEVGEEWKDAEQPEDTGWDSASESENDKEKGVSDISDLEKQVKTLTAEKAQLQEALKAKDEVLKDSIALVEELVKRIDELESVLEQKEELIEKAKNFREKKGGAFMKKEENSIVAKFEEIQAKGKKMWL